MIDRAMRSFSPAGTGVGQQQPSLPVDCKAKRFLLALDVWR
jgi:hypothetical protein